MARRVRPGLTAAEGRKFAFTLTVAFGVLTGILLWRDHQTAAWVTGGIASFLFVGGVVAPARLGPIERAWMGFALLLSRITTPIVMGLVYFLVVTPLGFGMRLLGRDPLDRGAEGESAWVPRTSAEGRGTMRNQF